MYLQVLGMMLWMRLGPLVSRPHLASRICSFISFAESGKVAAISSSSPYSSPSSSSSGTPMTHVSVSVIPQWSLGLFLRFHLLFSLGSDCVISTAMSPGMLILLILTCGPASKVFILFAVFPSLRCLPSSSLYFLFIR